MAPPDQKDDVPVSVVVVAEDTISRVSSVQGKIQYIDEAIHWLDHSLVFLMEIRIFNVTTDTTHCHRTEVILLANSFLLQHVASNQITVKTVI